MNQVFIKIIETNIIFTIIIAILFWGMHLIGKKFTAKCRYILWALIFIRLTIPFGSFSEVALFTLELPITEAAMTQNSVLSSNFTSSNNWGFKINKNSNPKANNTSNLDNSSNANNTSNSNAIHTSDIANEQQNQQGFVNSDNTNGINISNESSATTLSTTAQAFGFMEIYGAFILSVLALIWVSIATIYFLWHIAIYLLFAANLKKNLIPADQTAHDILLQLCAQKKINRIPNLCISKKIGSPMLFGFFRSTIVIPENLKNSESLLGIITHELIRYKRKDLWLKLITMFAESVHWFNPLIHIAARKFESEMELSCDELVLKNYGPEARTSYGNAMLEIVKRCQSKNTALTTHFNPQKSSIKERFMNILDITKKRPGKPFILIMVLVCVLAGTLIACGTAKSTATDVDSTTNTETETLSADGSGSKEVETGTLPAVSTPKETETEEAGLFTPIGTARVIKLYQNPGYKEIISDSDKKGITYDFSKYILIGSYPCTNAGAYSLCSYGSKILVYDGAYFIYDYISGKSKEIIIPISDIKFCDFVYGLDSQRILGLSICVDNSFKYAFYSIKTQTFITDFSYRRINSPSVHNCINVTLSNSEGLVTLPNMSEGLVLDIDTGKVLLSMKGKYINASFLNNKNGFYILENESMHASYDIYNSDFKLILSKDNSYNDQIMLSDNGNITVIDPDRTTYSSYNQKGERVFRSREFKQVFVLSNNLVCVVDTDGYLKLIDFTTGAELIKYIEWSDKMDFFFSSFYEEAYQNYPAGLYIMTWDTSVSVDTVGYMKEYYYNPSTGAHDILQFIKKDGYEKPVLYLYPTVKTDVTVKFAAPSLLTTTYPKYKDSWNVTANPDGSLYDANGRYYYGLYWEENCFQRIDFKTGFYVTADNASEFLEEKLDILGFTQREANEFIMYWLPILEKNGQNLVYFELTESREAYNVLNITPVPDSMLRVAIHVKAVDSYVNIQEEYLPTFQRNGFTVVEWGGVSYN